MIFHHQKGQWCGSICFSGVIDFDDDNVLWDFNDYLFLLKWQPSLLERWLGPKIIMFCANFFFYIKEYSTFF